LEIAVNEGNQNYEGLALAVIFDDPNQTTDQSVILYFGGLKPTGGTATINFGSPIDTTANLAANLGFGIGYSFNSGPVVSQSSQVKVNDQLLTSVAGHFDDGEGANGALFTVGGLGDSPNNPDPNTTDYTTDDEFYNVLPFIKNGDTSLKLDTVNPSNNDHIFFAHLTLQGITAVDSSNVVQLSVAPSSVNEDGANKLVYTFTRTGDKTNPLTVSYKVDGSATLNTDYTQTGADSFTNSTGTVTFAANSDTATVTISPVADTVIEPDETVILSLNTGTGYAVGTSAPVIGTILNDDNNLLPTISIEKGTDAAEPNTNGTFTLTRTGDVTSALTANLELPTGTATSGVDYDPALPTTVNFAAGSQTATVTVTTKDDNIFEGSESVILKLANGTGYTVDAAKNQAEVAITDNDPKPTISVGNISQVEGNSGTTKTYVFDVTLSNPSVEPITVKYSTENVTATAGTDYQTTTGTLTFNPLETSKTVSVEVTGDNLFELDETFKLNLSNAVNATIGTASAIGTIVNDDLPVITIEKGTDASEPHTNGSFILNRDGDPSLTLTVKLALPTGTATNGSDYQTLPTEVTFAAGSATAIVEVKTIADKLLEGRETICLALAEGNGYILGTATHAEINLFDKIIKGDHQDNVLKGGKNDDIIEGLGCNDTIYGKGGDDCIDGGKGNDKLYGEKGRDLIYGGHGNDTIDGGEDKDVIYGDKGDDTIYGGNGNDTVYGGSGKDTIYGGEGNDCLAGNEGKDTIYGGDGHDEIYGGLGNDKLDGGKNHDILDGVLTSPLVLPVAAHILGKGEIDCLKGGAGKDLFVLGMASDLAHSLTGATYYVGEKNRDYALIEDFQIGKHGDCIQLFGSASDYELAAVRSGSLPHGVGIYSLDGGRDLVGILQGVSLSSLHLNDHSQFSFVS
jgi:Ca2+-binding RTX toxin-like protein